MSDENNQGSQILVTFKRKRPLAATNDPQADTDAVGDDEFCIEAFESEARTSDGAAAAPPKRGTADDEGAGPDTARDWISALARGSDAAASGARERDAHLANGDGDSPGEVAAMQLEEAVSAGGDDAEVTRLVPGVVPAGCGPGDRFWVFFEDRKYWGVVPHGARAGDTIACRADRLIPASALCVSVPEGLAPGQAMSIRAPGGGVVSAVLPAGATPGTIVFYVDGVLRTSSFESLASLAAAPSPAAPAPDVAEEKSGRPKRCGACAACRAKKGAPCVGRGSAIGDQDGVGPALDAVAPRVVRAPARAAARAAAWAWAPAPRRTREFVERRALAAAAPPPKKKRTTHRARATARGPDAAAASGARDGGGTCLGELRYLGVTKIGWLEAHGIDTVEALAKFAIWEPDGAYNPINIQITGNVRPDRAATTMAKWRALAQAFLENRRLNPSFVCKGRRDDRLGLHRAH